VLAPSGLKREGGPRQRNNGPAPRENGVAAAA